MQYPKCLRVNTPTLEKVFLCASRIDLSSACYHFLCVHTQRNKNRKVRTRQTWVRIAGPGGVTVKKGKGFSYHHVQLLFFVTTQQQSRNLRFFDQSISFHSRFNHMRTNGAILWTFNSFSYYWSVLNRRNSPSTKVRQLSVCACGFSA